MTSSATTVHQETIEGENFHKIKNYPDCLPVLMPKDTAPPNFTEKTFVNSYKNLKICKSFLSRKLPTVWYSTSDPTESLLFLTITATKEGFLNIQSPTHSLTCF